MHDIGLVKLTVWIPSGNMKLICRVLSFGNPGRSLCRITQVVCPSGWQPFSTLYFLFTPSLAAWTADQLYMNYPELIIIIKFQ